MEIKMWNKNAVLKNWKNGNNSEKICILNKWKLFTEILILDLTAKIGILKFLELLPFL